MTTSFNEFCLRYELAEKALNLGDRSISYPKDNNVVILAGGAGSGKGVILDKLLTIRGKVFNVDDIKKTLLKLGDQTSLSKTFEKETHRSLGTIELGEVGDTMIMHDFIERHKLNDSLTNTFFWANTTNKYRPNVVFDVTLKDINKLQLIDELCNIGNYRPINRHLVWVLTNIDVAIDQNASRDRKVDHSILLRTHEGASRTIEQLVKQSDRSIIDGDVWIVFNGATINGRDLKLKGNVVQSYQAFQLKQQGKPWKSVHDIEQVVWNKINSYVPASSKWTK